MKRNRIITAVLSLTMILSLVLSSVVFAVDYGVDTMDTINKDAKGSITIHKYDLTAANNANVDTTGLTASGKTDDSAEEMLKDYAIKGVEFTYLKVGGVIQDSDAGTVKLLYEIPKALQIIIGLTEESAKVIESKDYYTSNQINDALAASLLDNTATKNKLEEYITSGTALNLTDTNGVTTKTDLDLGLYLIVETKVPEDVVSTTDPFFVQLPMTDAEGESWFYDVVLYPKNQTGNPTLEKKVRNNPNTENIITDLDKETFVSERNEYKYQDTVTASEGEDLDYYLLSKLPHITSSATYLKVYTFKDTMSKGINYKKDAVIAIYDGTDTVKQTNVNNVKESGAVAVWEESDGRFRTAYDNENNTMEVVFTAEGLKDINTKYSDKYIAVYYTAKVNSDDSVLTGDKGNPNDVTLTWKRTSEEYYDILTDECIVYTYDFDITKEFADSKGDPTKVKFAVKNTTDGNYVVASGTEGVYHVTGRTDTMDDATIFSPASDGILKISGIEADTYAITETATDKGYNLLKDSIIVNINAATATITPTKANITGTQSKKEVSVANDGVIQGLELKDTVTVETNAASATVDGKNSNMKASETDADSTNASVVIKVINEKSFNIPQTGRAGIYIMTVFGALLLVFGISRMGKKEKVTE